MADKADKTPLRTYLVEHYDPGLDVADAQQSLSRLRLAIGEMEREGKAVRHLGTTIVPGDESVLCLLEAASEALVTEAHRRAGTTFQRISIAITDIG